MGRGWTARQPELTGDNANRPVVKPQVNRDFGVNLDVTEAVRTDYGSEGWGLSQATRASLSGRAEACCAATGLERVTVELVSIILWDCIPEDSLVVRNRPVLPAMQGLPAAAVVAARVYPDAPVDVPEDNV